MEWPYNGYAKTVLLRSGKDNMIH